MTSPASDPSADNDAHAWLSRAMPRMGKVVVCLAPLVVFDVRAEEPAPAPVPSTAVADTLRTSRHLGRTEKASTLLGMEVKNLQGDKIGSVDNLITDLDGGRLLAVIVSTGGFLGLGDELSAVPPAAFSFAADGRSLVLNATKDSLAKAPHFNAKEWPDWQQTAYADSIYRAYNVEAYFSTNRADNTARNVRDRDHATLTPFDQGNSAEEINLTAEIRKSINSNTNISVNAQNVKIITKGDRVTLRGPVDNPEEKHLIRSIAKQLAGEKHVNDQIEVVARANK